MSDIDPTPDTPVTIGDRMGWWRGDMAARLTTLEAQVAALAGTPAGTLGQVRTDLAALQTGITGLRSDLDALRGPQERNLSQLYTALYDGLFIQGESVNYPAHIRLDSELQDIASQIDLLQAGLGAVPYESLELASVRGLLSALLTSASVSTRGLAPIIGADDTDSEGDVYDGGRLYALWGRDPDPPHVTGYPGPGTKELTATTWAGWRAYIQTADPAPWVLASVVPPNRWFDLSGTGIKTFSVLPQHTIRVYLRKPSIAGWISFASSFVTVTGGNSPRPAVVWGTALPPQYPITTAMAYTWSEPVIINANVNGWTFECDADSPNYYQVASFTSNRTAFRLTVPVGGTVVVSSNTTHVVLDNPFVRNLQFSGRVRLP